MAVCEVADEAQKFIYAGRDDDAIGHLIVIAALDGDDKTIAEVVDFARRELESRSVECEPSVEREYQEYLESLPPHNRYVMLARQCMRELGSGLEGLKKRLVAQRAVYYFDLAAQIKPLGKRDQKMVAVLRKEAGP